jgi:hypothetical protein
MAQNPLLDDISAPCEGFFMEMLRQLNQSKRSRSICKHKQMLRLRLGFIPSN